MQVGIIGCGAIGSHVARVASDMPGVGGLWLYDIDPDATALLADLPNTSIAERPAQLLSNVDLLIECANKGVVETTVRDALAAGKSAMLLTIGALADDELRDDLTRLASETGAKVYLPSGAIMGVDGLRAAKEAGIQSVTLVTTKPPQGLERDVDKWTLLFNGPAREAVKRFPKNVNVAATLSLAGLGLDDTWVQVAVDPLATRNSHKLIIDGEFGRARIEVENLPSPENPKTSYLASLSAIAMLRRIVSPIEVGA